MPRLVLADTSGLFASLDADDPHHLQARSFLAGRSATYIVADTIFAETMTLVKIPLGASLAINLGREILAGAPFRFHRLTDDEQAETWSIFSRSTDKEWSFADCSLLALARRLNVDEVFAFDHHFDQMSDLGLRRRP
jgi:predicted nucleic acid-binding protein